MLRGFACAMLVVACARPPSPSPPPLAVRSVAPPPTPADGDGDGILDEGDRCPQDPGGAADGCPTPDSDGDGILDPDDSDASTSPRRRSVIVPRRSGPPAPTMT